MVFCWPLDFLSDALDILQQKAFELPNAGLVVDDVDNSPEWGCPAVLEGFALSKLGKRWAWWSCYQQVRIWEGLDGCPHDIAFVRSELMSGCKLPVNSTRNLRTFDVQVIGTGKADLVLANKQVQSISCCRSTCTKFQQSHRLFEICQLLLQGCPRRIVCPSRLIFIITLSITTLPTCWLPCWPGCPS